jgi:pimeloyl-ACP methyl ester carboxylesterase
MVFALVHGAWHGGWVWSELATELERSGHRVVAPDLGCEEVDSGASDYARVVVDALGGERDAIVVGHSLGGVTIALVPARMHVYLSAFVPQSGRAPRDRGPEALRPGFADAAIRDEFERSYWPDPAVAARDLQYPAGAEALAGRLRRQARKPSTERCPLPALPETPRAVIVCSNDYAVPPDWQRRVAREELHVEPIELESGHSPMLSCPVALAEILDRLAASMGAASSS